MRKEQDTTYYIKQTDKDYTLVQKKNNKVLDGYRTVKGDQTGYESLLRLCNALNEYNITETKRLYFETEMQWMMYNLNKDTLYISSLVSG
jgi:hypothetical protein